MLSELVVHNLAIIRHLEVSFGHGLNIVSGETGAGKSILVGAVNLVLGSRASQELIRTGAKEAAIEATFHLPRQPALVNCLSELGCDFTGELVVLRTINRNGRSRIFINDQLVTLQQFQRLTGFLASISGQHEHQSLLNPDLHFGMLDSFGDLEDLSGEVAKIFKQWLNARDELLGLRSSKQEKTDQLDWMRFQLQELEAAELKADEDGALAQEITILRHAATLHEAAQSSFQTIYADRSAILGQLASVEKQLEVLTAIDGKQQSLLSHLEQARIHLEELAHSLQKYASGIIFDPQRLSAIEERLAVLQRLGKKYGGSVAQLIQRRDELRHALVQDEQSDLLEATLESNLANLREDYLEKAKMLSKRRHEAATRLAHEVEKVLAALDMDRATFAVLFEANGMGAKSIEANFSAAGIDRGQFLLSANPGEELKPLAKVASGGELSRILLALKALLSRQGEAETLIFDEVDAGIGGRTAELVGRQLKNLAEKHQVICITHLPQIACYGGSHYKVVKQTKGDETITNIGFLSHEERVEELARMLGGISISDKTRAQAVEFLHRAQQN
ncbi:MAG: DNA repair protein RecN [Desulforhabdus sp.]|jgi:DNA repair protein RecN (Recombination protein N)|nr:DNA repair protein RecN [Desulforhabdus sp.]